MSHLTTTTASQTVPSHLAVNPTSTYEVWSISVAKTTTYTSSWVTVLPVTHTVSQSTLSIAEVLSINGISTSTIATSILSDAGPVISTNNSVWVTISVDSTPSATSGSRPSNSSSKSHTTIIVIAVIVPLFLLALFASLWYCIRKERRKVRKAREIAASSTDTRIGVITHPHINKAYNDPPPPKLPQSNTSMTTPRAPVGVELADTGRFRVASPPRPRPISDRNSIPTTSHQASKGSKPELYEMTQLESLTSNYSDYSVDPGYDRAHSPTGPQPNNQHVERFEPAIPAPLQIQKTRAIPDAFTRSPRKFYAANTEEEGYWSGSRDGNFAQGNSIDLQRQRARDALEGQSRAPLYKAFIAEEERAKAECAAAFAPRNINAPQQRKLEGRPSH